MPVDAGSGPLSFCGSGSVECAADMQERAKRQECESGAFPGDLQGVLSGVGSVFHLKLLGCGMIQV